MNVREHSSRRFPVLQMDLSRIHDHYSFALMSAMASKSPASPLFTQPFIQSQIKENIKAPRHWLLCGDSPLTGEFPTQRASNVENVSISWRQNIIHVGLASISLIILGLLPFVLPRRQVNDCFYFGNVILKNGKLIRDSIMLTFNKVLCIIFCKYIFRLYLAETLIFYEYDMV